MTIRLHDPDAVLDYTFDWSTWLASGETIASASVSVSDGLTVESTTTGTDAVTIRISTDGTLGPRTITCSVVSNVGQEDDWTTQLNVIQK